MLVKMAKHTQLLGLICLFTMTMGKPVVRRCMLPDCGELTVKSSEVRDVFVTACNINKVTIIGDAKGVRIHSIKGSLCGE